VADHRERLRAELIAAARREHQRLERRPLRRLVPVAVAAAALVVAVALGSVLRSDPVAADVFRIQRTGSDQLVVDVIGPIRDPERAAAELEAVGLSVTLEAVPTPPSLVGDLVALTVEAPVAGPVAPLEPETDGARVVGSRAEPRGVGRVVIHYGRPAADGEPYTANDTVPGCEDLSGERISDDVARRITREHGPSIRWQLLDDGRVRELPFDQLPEDAVVLRVIGLASDAALAVVTTSPDWRSDPTAC
jgi:hypothetical protein